MLYPADLAIVVIYIILIFSIALRANVFMRRQFVGIRKEGLRPIENHYLAGKSITFPEAFLSIIATEFSALAFLIIPTYAYFENLNHLKFVIGACISRAIIAFFFLPLLYNKGLTILEVLARGVNGYQELTPANVKGKKLFALFYIFSKILGVSIKLLGGATLIAEFFNLPLFFSIIIISILTYLYIMLGGLKAVVRTDMLQATIFIIGGFAAHYVVGKMSHFTWGELINFGIDAGKFSLFASEGILSFIYGVIAGIVYDAATHGVDQDLTQKLFGAKDIETARRSLAWSALGSLLVNMLFLSLGVVLWAYYTKHGQVLPHPTNLFSSLIENHFPSPMKGLMVASILAACMSTLDSSINALSAVFWNDLMSVEKSRMFRVYINLDNFIITISIIIFAYLFSIFPGLTKLGLQFAYFSTSPLIAFFIFRMLLSKYIKTNFSPSLIIMSFASSLLGMALNHFSFGFNPQLTIIWGVITNIIFMWIYNKINNFISNNSGDSI